MAGKWPDGKECRGIRKRKGGRTDLVGVEVLEGGKGGGRGGGRFVSLCSDTPQKKYHILKPLSYFF